MNERIRQLRKALNMTQQELADKIGVKRSTISLYEIGRNEPIGAIVNIICEKLNVSEIWLRTGEGEMFMRTMELKKEIVSARIQSRRKELNLTLAEVAKRCGLSEPTVWRLESGDIKSLKMKNLDVIAQALNTTPSYLMGWEKTPEQMEQEDRMILEAYHRASPELQEAIKRILQLRV